LDQEQSMDQEQLWTKQIWQSICSGKSLNL